MAEAKYTVNDLYRHLFETIDELRANKIDVAKAESIKNLAQTIVNTGKLECRFIESVGGKGTGFMPDEMQLTRDRLRLIDRSR